MNTLLEFNVTTPQTVCGLIATGDTFISSTQQTQTLIDGQPDVLACEMEGAACAQVCDDYDVIRFICYQELCYYDIMAILIVI